jgi:hypothetical protein
VPELPRKEAEPNIKMLPSAMSVLPKISIAISNSSDNVAFSSLTMFIQLLLGPARVGGKFWSENKTMIGSLLTILCSVIQLKQVSVAGSKEQLIDSLTETLPFMIRDPWKVLVIPS